MTIPDYVGYLLWNNTETPYFGTVQWFLICLFFTQIMSSYILKSRYKFLISLSVFTIGILISSLGIRIPFSFDIAMIAQFLFLNGYFIKQYYRTMNNRNNTLSNIKIIFFISLVFIVSFFTNLLNGYVNMRTFQFNNPILFLINAYLGSIILYLISRLTWTLFRNNSIIDSILYIGKNTILILLLHRFFDGLVKTMFITQLSFLQNNSKIMYYTLSFVGSLLVIIMLKPIISFINNKFAWTVGRF